VSKPAQNFARSQITSRSILTLSEQQYFVCDTASQSTKLEDILEIWGTMVPLAPWLCLWLKVKLGLESH